MKVSSSISWRQDTACKSSAAAGRVGPAHMPVAALWQEAEAITALVEHNAMLGRNHANGVLWCF